MIIALSKLTKNYFNSFGRNNSFKPASFKANDEFIFGEENIIEFNKVEQSKKQNMTSDKVKFFIIVKLKSILPTTYLKKALDTISDERLLKTTISNHDLPQVMQNIFIEKNIPIYNLYHNTSYIEDSMPLIETLGIDDVYCSKAILV
ncbi:hypothetical protein A1I_06115 [Rickettsia bellii OSU 85-389]|uniref:hypothetical protein n=1 Tax=Rickettsia bellii TaxID=33990 RepID=UPI0000DB1005|nr:hypothetical protein [Rickettsia bellii]ABV79543.1 hypothetical protein A1I_06115 [Rickettsia bellii OSU 85-389]